MDRLIEGVLMEVRMNSKDDLQLVYPTEVNGHPGFYRFPDDHRIGVNKDGQFLNCITGKILKPQLHTKSNGYQVVITSPDKKPVNHKVHRVIARTFIGRPSRHLDKPFSMLQVNHVDGSRSNNSIDNLEWVTGKENVEHAHLSGLSLSDTPIVAKFLGNSQQELYFNSLREFSRHFEVHPSTVHRCLKRNLQEKHHVNNYIFKYEDGKPWSNVSKNKLTQLGSYKRNGASISYGGYRRTVLVTSIKDRITEIFDSLKDAINKTKQSYVGVNHQIRRKGFAVIGNFEYKYI